MNKFKRGDRVIYVGSSHKRLLSKHGTVADPRVITFEGYKVSWVDDTNNHWVHKGSDLAHEEPFHPSNTGFDGPTGAN